MKLLLTGIAALFLAIGTAHAERIPPPDHSRCTNCRTTADHKLYSCIYYYVMKKQQDPRFGRAQYVPPEQLPQNHDAMSLVLEARRACGR